MRDARGGSGAAQRRASVAPKERRASEEVGTRER